MSPPDIQITSELERLERLRAAGTITADEFDSLKANILRRFSQPIATQQSGPETPKHHNDKAGIKITAHQLIGFGGSLVVVFGCFAPLFHLPIVGSINYIFNGRGDGMLVLALALAAAALTFFRKYRLLAFATLAISAVCAFTFIQFVRVLANFHSGIDVDLRGNPFRGFADALASSVGFDWAWPVLIAGIALLIIASVTGTRFERALESTSSN